MINNNQKLPFAENKASEKFYQEVIVLLIKEFDSRRQKYVLTENMQTFHHGLGWNFQRQEKAGFKPHSGELKLVSTQSAIEIGRIISNDVSVIADFILEIADRMEENLVKGLSSKMSAVAEEAGNTISIPKGGSLADAYLEMLKTTQASVDRDGKISEPNFIFNSPGFLEQLAQEILERGPEFQEKIKMAKNEEEQEARKREEERLAKYNILE